MDKTYLAAIHQEISEGTGLLPKIFFRFSEACCLIKELIHNKEHSEGERKQLSKELMAHAAALKTMFNAASQVAGDKKSEKLVKLLIELFTMLIGAYLEDVKEEFPEFTNIIIEINNL